MCGQWLSRFKYISIQKWGDRMECCAAGFTEISEQEESAINGGGIVLAVAGAIAAGAAAYFAYEIADEGVKRSTGKSIGQHISNAVGNAAQAIGSGLQSLGNWIAGY